MFTTPVSKNDAITPKPLQRRRHSLENECIPMSTNSENDVRSNILFTEDVYTRIYCPYTGTVAGDHQLAVLPASPTVVPFFRDMPHCSNNTFQPDWLLACHTMYTYFGLSEFSLVDISGTIQASNVWENVVAAGGSVNAALSGLNFRLYCEFFLLKVASQ